MVEREVVQVGVGADLQGVFVRRYKRFFADIQARDGRELTVHCPNPGSMRGLLSEGSPVWCSTSNNPKRKLKHTLEMVEANNVWVGLHTLRANQVARCILEAGSLPMLSGYSEVRREVRVGSNSRLDFVLDGNSTDKRIAFVEVKSVTMALGSRALFPDSVTRRGKKHMELLGDLSREGNRSVLMFIIQRSDCEIFSTADDIDPAYGSSLREAVDKGVEIVAIRTRVTPSSIYVETPIRVEL